MGKQELAQQPMMTTMLEHTPLGRTGTADEIAAVVEFLVATPPSYMTGTDILVDGGVVPNFRRPWDLGVGTRCASTITRPPDVRRERGRRFGRKVDERFAAHVDTGTG